MSESCKNSSALMFADDFKLFSDIDGAGSKWLGMD